MENSQTAQRDLALVAEITALRKQDSTAQPSLEQLRAIDRVLVEQARERLGLPESQKSKAGACNVKKPLEIGKEFEKVDFLQRTGDENA